MLGRAISVAVLLPSHWFIKPRIDGGLLSPGNNLSLPAAGFSSFGFALRVFVGSRILFIRSLTAPIFFSAIASSFETFLSSFANLDLDMAVLSQIPPRLQRR